MIAAGARRRADAAKNHAAADAVPLSLYITAFIDRVNVSFAGLQMTRELHFSNEVFGFGSGIFFFGYCLLEIPGAVLAEGGALASGSPPSWSSGASWPDYRPHPHRGRVPHHSIPARPRRRRLLPRRRRLPDSLVSLQDRAKAIALFMAAIPVSNVCRRPDRGISFAIQLARPLGMALAVDPRRHPGASAVS